MRTMAAEKKIIIIIINSPILFEWDSFAVIGWLIMKSIKLYNPKIQFSPPSKLDSDAQMLIALTLKMELHQEKVSNI